MTQRQSSKVQCFCRACGAGFVTTAYRVCSGRGLHCSVACARRSTGAALRNPVNRKCLVCGIGFETKPSRIRDGGGKHCSKACSDFALRRDPIARFWDQVDRSAGPDGCWPWAGNVVQGVGSIRVGDKTWRTNRLAWTIAHGDLAPRQPVKATCGNNLCCNPAHLVSFASDDPARFWSLIDRSGGAESCWPWMGGLNEDGYGLVYVNGKTMTAHRHAWRLTNGDPGDLCVCHSCDNPPCCNPAHHWLGTNEENTADRTAKGRWKVRAMDRVA